MRQTTIAGDEGHVGTARAYVDLGLGACVARFVHQVSMPSIALWHATAMDMASVHIPHQNVYAIRIGWEGTARFSCAQQDQVQHPMTHAGLVPLAPSRRWSVSKSVHYVQGASIRQRLELLRRQPASRVLRARTRMCLGAPMSRTAFAMQDTRWMTTESNAQGADQARTRT